MKKLMSILFAVVAMASTARAESLIQSGGPRFGLVYITDSYTRNQLVKLAREKKPNANVSKILTAFGWQFEYEYLNTTGGATGLIEFVPVVVGLESGLALPSACAMIGVRFANGLEIGFGPNFSTGVTETLENEGAPDEKVKYHPSAGVGMTGMVGITLRTGDMNFPINLAAVRNENGYRTSLMLGWTR